MKVAALATALCLLAAHSAQADQSQNSILSCNNDGRCITRQQSAAIPHKTIRSHHSVIDGNGNTTMMTVRTRYGFDITVHPAYAGKFQKFFALLKEHGYKVSANITKCWTPRGTRIAGSNHYIGAACDIQTGWNSGPAFIYHMSDIIKQAGLYDGCSFHDCGHIEAIRGTHNTAPNLYAAMEKFKSEQSTANYQP
jgi:hypothetical protein